MSAEERLGGHGWLDPLTRTSAVRGEPSLAAFAPLPNLGLAIEQKGLRAGEGLFERLPGQHNTGGLRALERHHLPAKQAHVAGRPLLPAPIAVPPRTIGVLHPHDERGRPLERLFVAGVACHAVGLPQREGRHAMAIHPGKAVGPSPQVAIIRALGGLAPHIPSNLLANQPLQAERDTISIFRIGRCPPRPQVGQQGQPRQTTFRVLPRLTPLALQAGLLGGVARRGEPRLVGVFSEDRLQRRPRPILALHLRQPSESGGDRPLGSRGRPLLRRLLIARGRVAKPVQRRECAPQSPPRRRRRRQGRCRFRRFPQASPPRGSTGRSRQQRRLGRSRCAVRARVGRRRQRFLAPLPRARSAKLSRFRSPRRLPDSGFAQDRVGKIVASGSSQSRRVGWRSRAHGNHDVGNLASHQ